VLLNLKEKNDLAPFKAGAFVGEIVAILAGDNFTTSVVALTDGWGYSLNRQDLTSFLNRNPGIKLSFLDTNFIDVIKEEERNDATDQDQCPF